MSRATVTIVSNQNHSIRSAIVITGPPVSSIPLYDQILRAAKNKLRLKKPTAIFTMSGEEVSPSSLLSLTLLEATYHIASGEPFIGSHHSSTASTAPALVTVLAAQSAIAPDAYTQLKGCSHLPGMAHCFGMPDLHPGGKTPIGAVFQTTGRLYPDLIGGDIGCGMTVFRTRLTKEQVEGKKAERLAGMLTKQTMECGMEGRRKVKEEIKRLCLGDPNDLFEDVDQWDDMLGSIGSGNHFAELQLVSHLASATQDDLTQDEVVLVVHSGSRQFGQDILRRYPKPLAFPSAEASVYLKLHDLGLAWARANRLAIAFLFFSAVEGPISVSDLVARRLLDLTHNYVRQEDPTTGQASASDTLSHRKGATCGVSSPLAIIPGSRGTLTAYVRPTSTVRSGHSLAHGAGRSASRKVTSQKMAERYVDSRLLERTDLGGIVICEDKSLIYEEAPEGYKDVGAVVADLVEAGECEILAWAVPRISYKVRR
ncbi:release factor H-coupled RctB family protein, partial [Tremellales sp. Uapishka_1]